MGYNEVNFGYLRKFTEEGLQDVPKANDKSIATTETGASLWKSAGNGYVFMPCTLGGIELWNPIMRVTGRKTIIETSLVERKGSVKEIINQDDYVINIRGVIKTTDGSWPDKEVKMLKELFERNESLDIISALTAIMLEGNEHVVITNLTLPEQQGRTESVIYELELTSDQAFELELEG